MKLPVNEVSYKYINVKNGNISIHIYINNIWIYINRILSQIQMQQPQ